MHVKHVLIPAELTVHRGGYYIKSPRICQDLFYFSAVCAQAVSGVAGRRRQQCRKYKISAAAVSAHENTYSRYSDGMVRKCAKIVYTHTTRNTH